jgi:hypothetical protein
MPALIVNPKAVEAGADLSFSQVKELRNLNDFALFARACCMSHAEVIDAFQQIDSVSLCDKDVLATERGLLHGYIQSIDVLVPRIRNTLGLVSLEWCNVEVD